LRTLGIKVKRNTSMKSEQNIINNYIEKMNNQLLLDNLRCIPDWPIDGVNFRDVTTLFKSPEALKEIADEMCDFYANKGITKIVGIESRGFVMSSAVAVKLGAGIVLCRKPGKLPCKTVQESYAKEYGIDTIEIHEDAINENDVILLHDDLLATGGTMLAACNLVKKFHPKKIYCNFIIELNSEFPKSRELFDKDIEITSLLKF
jgi:adenine phosphoribosyltransferase